MCFKFNVSTRECSGYRIIAKRSEFPPSLSRKSPELDDVLFPAGISNPAGMHTDLYAGLSDYCCGKLRIPNPFNSR
jgi:hypothetical protein